ncbi:hypothetical protein SAMD00019534_017210 [Acytostelium subglobosum LB1]|uniref:hypothetical protein n=1 Tax=Acytostelium subglobosum LB1 TaxID=1410327 RepID=UPI0006451B3D|nr:hypothetical protein SAMD00019534_017210 [Acytostelium subglobosum LB1]GAM18546.1 hypothetical protein SAMD00019534_017210 [Acytostelium subglobosum LB1]|eukprot:XP_012757766.1 hypothetical protein SAMD00019534_017210 [Acytostelium subglobosum LB1]
MFGLGQSNKDRQQPQQGPTLSQSTTTTTTAHSSSRKSLPVPPQAPTRSLTACDSLATGGGASPTQSTKSRIQTASSFNSSYDTLQSAGHLQQQQQQQHQQQQQQQQQQHPPSPNSLSSDRQQLQREREAHNQTKKRVAQLEEENKIVRDNLSALRTKYERSIQKILQLTNNYNAFQKAMVETLQEVDLSSPAAVPVSTSSSSSSSTNTTPSLQVPNAASSPLPITPRTSPNMSISPPSALPAMTPSGTISGRPKALTISEGSGRYSISKGRGFNAGMLSPPSVYPGTIGALDMTINFDLDDPLQINPNEEEYARMMENRKAITNQILKTETEYASHLSLIVEEFLNPMRVESYQSNNPFVTAVHVKQLFGDVEVILGSSGLLIEDLEKVISDPANRGLGDVFLKICDYFKLYSPYVKNYYTSITVLNKLKEESHKFQAFIHEKEQRLEHTNFSDLGSLLVLPLSRISQYTPMLSDLFRSTPKRHPDYEPLKNAVIKMKSIVDYVKEKSREYESQNKVRSIQSQMLGKFNNLNEPHRRYVREGLLTEIQNKGNGNGNQLHCFLFNDLLILSSPVVKKQQTNYMFKKEIRLCEADVVTLVGDSEDRPVFQISFMSYVQADSGSGGLTTASVLNSLINGSSVSESEQRETLAFCADSVRDREEWVQTLNTYIAIEKKKLSSKRAEELIESKGEIDFKNSDIQLCEQIGSGGSGCTVHRCTVDGFTCAVKILRVKNTQPFLVEQFVSEIKIMEQLNHQNIAKYLAHRLTNNPERLWLFMEFYPFSLKDIITKKTTPFPATEIVWMALEIAKGIEYLHNQKPPIVHRDLKPGNVMCLLDERNRVSNIRVCDFDTSKVMTSGVVLKTCIGTPSYMAPEVLDVSLDANAEGYSLKADIWSFAMLVFEIMTLQPPYHQFAHLQTIEMILKGTPPPLTTPVSAGLQGLVDLLHQCLELNANKRPSASSVVSKLVKLMKQSGKLQE